MKKTLIILLTLLMVFPLFSQSFTDSIGRTVELPDTIDRVAPSGNLSQMILYSIAPEKISGWSIKLSTTAKGEYFLKDTAGLPVFGTFYGKKANLNKEALMSANPQVVMDMGEIKGGIDAMREDLDNLMDDIKIPVITLEAYLDNIPDVYRTLGTLLDKEERGEELAAYAEEALSMAASARDQITDPVTVYYSSSDDGLEAIPTGSFHGEVIEKIGARNVVPASFSAQQGSVSLEQIYLWDPDVILLSNEKAYDSVMKSKVWGLLSAVKNNRVYLVPSEPYSFIDSPPATNRIIGIYWLGNLLYPELYDVDIIDEVIEYYGLYYNYGMSEAKAKEVLGI